MLGSMMKTFVEVIDRWPSINELASDIGEKPFKVAKWKQRNNIPADYWLRLISAARKRRISLDEIVLTKIADGRRRRVQSTAGEIDSTAP